MSQTDEKVAEPRKWPRTSSNPVHPSPYGPVAEIAADRTLAEQPKLGFWAAVKAPLIWFFVGCTVFCLFSWDHLKTQSLDIHFVYQADAFLHGQLELTQNPPHGNDWASYITYTWRDGHQESGVWFDQSQDKFVTLSGEMLILDRVELRGARQERHYFCSFPPGPAVLMMPFVAIWGYDFHDVIFTIIFAALNLSLLYVLLRRVSRGGRSGRSPGDNHWLVILFGFGTSYLWCSIIGQVWFTALIIGTTFTLLYLIFAIDARRPLLAGLFLACAFATRTPLLFAGLVFPVFLFFPSGRFRRENWGQAFFKLALFCIFPLIIGSALLVINHMRFDNYLEFGHRYLAGRWDTIRLYGLFNYHFLARNLSAAFTLLPRIQPDAPYIFFSKHGMSLFLTTPVWFYLFRPKPREFRQDALWHRLLWFVVLLIAIPHFFYQNTGYIQFSYRFSLDYTPFLILLLAVGRYPFTKVFKGLVLVGFAVCAFGAITFARMWEFYSEWFFDP